MIRKLLPVVLVALLVFAGIYFSRHAQTDFGNQPVQESIAIKRIVSLSPSVTETVFALGAGKRLVGVSRYCTYPPEAKNIAKVGGYIDPSFEAIVRLKPDLVIVTSGNNENAEKIGELGLRVLSVDNNTIEGIVDSIGEIGRAIGATERAEEMTANIRMRIEKVKQQTQGLARPRVMISIGRSVGGGVDEIYVAGENNFYEEIINIAGGKNAYSSKIAKTPALSGEGITRLNPDIIIDFAPGKHGDEVMKTIKEWDTLQHVSAVKNEKVYVLTNDYVVVPGPRFINTLEDVAKVVHPEVKWSDN